MSIWSRNCSSRNLGVGAYSAGLMRMSCAIAFSTRAASCWSRSTIWRGTTPVSKTWLASPHSSTTC